MGKNSWEQNSKKNQTFDVVLPTVEDFFSLELPEEHSGWTRILVESLSDEQQLTGVTLLCGENQRSRFRKSRKKDFDQVLDLSLGAKSLEISGVNMLFIRVELERSSSLVLLKRVFLSAVSDVFRLGVRRRNLRTFFQMLRARDFKSVRERLLSRYNQSPLSTDLRDGVITPQIWMDRFVTLSKGEQIFVDASVKQNDLPTFSVVADSSCSPVQNQTLISVNQQKLGVQDFLVTNDFSEVLNSVSGEWIIFIKGSTELEEVATFALGVEAKSNPMVKMIVSDGSEKSGGAVCGIRANPPWNLDLVLTGEELGPLLAIHRSAISTISENIANSRMPTFTEMGLLIFEAFGEKAISQLSVVLCVNPQEESGEGVDHAVESYLMRSHPSALVVEGLCHGTRRVKWPIPEKEPKISILIPSKDQGNLLERCLEGVYENTDYTNIEVIIVDHQSTEGRARKLLESVAERDDTHVLNFEGDFNFSAMNNLAFNSCTGEIVCLLNNDIEVVNSGWLHELVSQIVRENVGAVGALLRYPDRSIQHAGLSPNLGGLFGHAHKYFPQGDFGYRNRLATTHRVAAVTGACLVTSRDLWEELEGLNESFAVAYNDVDFCLRIRQAGYDVLWTPFAELIHHESLSRGYDEHPKEGDRLSHEVNLLTSLWGGFLGIDPAYSPNLTTEDTNFSLSDQPRISPPWKR